MPAPILPIDDASLDAAARTLREGGLVAFPTETVYGLGADATSATAVARIFDVKGRPSFNPLIAHVADEAAARAIAEFDPAHAEGARGFGRGPRTSEGRRRPNGVSDLAAAGLDTVAVRAPSGPAIELLRRLDRPIAAPSANVSGKLSPTTADAVFDQLGDAVDLILDGGRCEVGVESTILGPGPTLLRAGGLALETLEAAYGAPIASGSSDGLDAPSAPGQLASHYAPAARLRLNASEPRPGEGWLGFGSSPDAAPADALSLSPSADLTEAAANLFAHLRRLDVTRANGVVAVAPIPEKGLGRAINDRLRRAAAPRA